MGSASRFIDDLQAKGRFAFTTEEAAEAVGLSLPSARAALHRLKLKGHVATPHRGFHVVVPPAHRRSGCLPAEQFIPELMAHLKLPYYAALLTAASYHGASHQSPLVYQVMVPTTRRPIDCGDVHVEFVARHEMQETSTTERNTPTGILRIATPEATALEITGYPQHCGYLDNVATVLAELGEVIAESSLVEEARRAPRAWVQRLGYLLCLVGADALADALEPLLHEGNTFPVPLAPWTEMTGAPRDRRWMLAVNIDVEPDL